MWLDNGARVSGTGAIIVPLMTGECCLWPEYPMGWARNTWMAVTLLAFAAGNATAAEPKRVLLLHSFGWNFQAEDAFGDYLDRKSVV